VPSFITLRFAAATSSPDERSGRCNHPGCAQDNLDAPVPLVAGKLYIRSRNSMARPGHAADDDPRGGQNRSPSPRPHGRTRMIVFPLIRLVGLKAATASSRVETLPTFRVDAFEDPSSRSSAAFFALMRIRGQVFVNLAACCFDSTKARPRQARRHFAAPLAAGVAWRQPSSDRLDTTQGTRAVHLRREHLVASPASTLLPFGLSTAS
jgi:hypothetical protein